MKQAKPPVSKPGPDKGKKPIPSGPPTKPKVAQPGRPFQPEPEEVAPLHFTWQMKVLGGLGLALLIGLVVILALQPNDRVEREDLNGSIITALANTGFTPPPTYVPGSEFGVSFVIFGIKDYIPALPNEQIRFVIINRRQKSLYVSNCDGVILQRFTGTDPKDKTQATNFDNWESIAPGGYRFCGPVSGRDARRIEPGVSADAAFKFDTKSTRPYAGKSWDVPGYYRLFVQYYLTCPDSTLKVDDCLDKHIDYSDSFRIIAPTSGTPLATIAPTTQP